MRSSTVPESNLNKCNTQSAGRCYKNIIIYWKTLNNTNICFGLETGFYRILHWLNLHVKYVKVNYIIQTCLISYAFASNFNPVISTSLHRLGPIHIF